MGVHAEEAVGRRLAVLLLIVGVPLPLKSQSRLVELVALHRVDYWRWRVGLWLAIGGDRVAAEVAVLVYSHHGPSLGPCHGVEVNHTSVGSLLEVQEPVFALLCVYPSALVRPVDVGLSLCHHYLMLVRSVGTL